MFNKVQKELQYDLSLILKPTEKRAHSKIIDPTAFYAF